MATVIYTGNAPANKQTGTIQITAYDAATTYTLTINGKAVSVAGTTDASGTASALEALAAASEYPEFQEIDWSVSTSTITLTAKTAGKSFTCTPSKSGGTGTIGSYTAVTANSGPGDVSQVKNYSTGALPSGSDTLVFENMNINLNEGLTALAAIALTQVRFKNWGGDVGLPAYTATGYYEYRQTYLQLQSTEVIFDCPDCQLARVDNQTYQTSLKVYNTGSSRLSNLEAFLWKGTHASNVAQFDKGTVGVAVLAGETAVIATMNCGYVTQPESDCQVRCGTGVTLTTVNRIGGTLETNSAITTVNSKEGSGLHVFKTSGTITTLNQDFGDVEYLSSGTITTMRIGKDRKFDAGRNEVGFTITNAVTMYYNSFFNDPAKRATMSGGYTPTGCTNMDVKVNRGINTTCTAA